MTDRARRSLRRLRARRPRRRSSPSDLRRPRSRDLAPILEALPAAGADIIELGMPFTDPMADGPAIQAAGLRALKGRQDADQDARHRRAFREQDRDTPIVLMGYYNPIYIYGVARSSPMRRRPASTG